MDNTVAIPGTFSVDARDRAGNTATGSPFEFAWDDTAPSVEGPDVVLSENAEAAALDDATDTVYYGPTAAGELRVAVTAADDQAGVRTLTFPSLFGAEGVHERAGIHGPERVTQTYTLDGGTIISDTYRVVVHDAVGNAGTSDSITIVHDAAGPTAVLTATATTGNTVVVAWAGTDTHSGIATYEVEYRDGDDNWTPWLSDTTETGDEFVAVPGHNYRFRVRAIDRVGNVGEWSIAEVAGDTTVTKYYYLGSRRVAMRRGEEVTYLHGDHLGSVRLATDGAGDVVHETRYAPFGQER